jgi:hypothetical protein
MSIGHGLAIQSDMTRPAGWLALLALLLIPCAPASAQEAAPPPVAKPAGNPPPPLFPNHRRGFYIGNDNFEVIDATPQSPPLVTDDPGVPDNGEFEINLLTEADLARDAHSVNLLTIDANYGVLLKGGGHQLPTQVKIEFPITARREGGNAYQVGPGESQFGLKFNFYNDESRGLRVAVYPQIEFSTGASVDKGIAEPGQTLVLPLLVSHESKYVTMVGNVGFEKPFHTDVGEATTELGFGLGRAFFRKLAIMGEIYTSSTTDFRRDRLIEANAGVIYGVRKAIWYARVGHSILSDDGRHAFVGFGLKVLIDTQHPSPSQP